jgi:hypothetical protein
MIAVFDQHFLDKKRPDSAPMKISLATELKIRDSTAGFGFRPKN